MNEATFALAERYLSGALPAQEAQAFEQQMQASPELAQAVELMRKADAALNDADALNFLKNVQAAQAAHLQQQQTTTIKTLPGRWWWAAAVVALLAVAGWFTFKPGAPTTEALFAANFAAYEAPGTYRNDSSLYPPALQQAFQAYQQANYVQAATGFEAYVPHNTFGTVAAFYLAQCQLATTPTPVTLQLLQGLATRTNHIYTSQAQWYLALASLKLGQRPQARQQLQPLANDPSHPYQAKATALLNQL